MSNRLQDTRSIEIQAPISRVWSALTDPKEIKKYLFGTEAVSDWKKGSSLIFRGEWQGKPYEDKGTILEIEPEKVLKFSYWSAMSGKPDSPENYSTLTFAVKPAGTRTTLSITQETNASQEGLDHSMKNWEAVLATIKKLMEVQDARN